ncbi:MAG: hypothetical protein IT310_11555 [Anaerolineales bacterium]|nr:hypothetical protein [Anaerolineales bacterium]
MNHKKSPSILVALASFTIIAAAIAATVIYFQPRTVSASSARSEQSDPISASAKITTPTSLSALQTQYPVVQNVKGVKMEVIGTSNEGAYFTVDVCYDLPDNKVDFMLGGQYPDYITLSTANETIPVYEIAKIGDFYKDSNGNYIKRCDHLRFPISPDSKLENVTLTISRVATTPAEILDCAKGQKKLDEAKQGIKVKCSDGSDHIGGFQIIEKPKEMDDITADAIAADAFIDIVEGPWVFKLK